MLELLYIIVEGFLVEVIFNIFTSVVYFLVSGSINFILEKYNIVYHTVKEGDFFGDYEVINNVLRVHTTIAKTECKMLILSKEVFINIKINFIIGISKCY